MFVNRALALLALLSLGGCYSGGYYYAGGGYYVGYRHHHPVRARVLYAPPAPQAVAVAAPPQAVPVAQPANAVKGSDGSFGWRIPTQNPEGEVQLLTEALARSGCQIESTTPTETRAQCGGVPVLVRSDSCDVFKVCESGTRGDVCAATWARIR